MEISSQTQRSSLDGQEHPPIIVNPLAVLQYVKCQELSAKMSTILEQVVDNEIISNITTPVKKRTRKPKAKSSEVEKPSPSVCNIDKTQSINYTVAELKQFLKENKLILTGTKQILHDRLFNWLRMTKGIIKTQAAFRGYFVRSSLKLFDKYQSMIAECVNDQDFYSFEPLKDIDKYQLICVKEPDGLVYGFDIASIYQYQKKLDFGAELTNPYNRNKFEPSFFSDLAKIATASRSGIVPTVLEINTKEEIECLPFEKRVELRAVDVFQHINSLGNYSDVSWFMLLSRRRLLLLIQELYDIWNYRLNINAETKMAICPPYGMPFDGAVVIDVSNATHNGLRNYILNIFENFVTKGVTRDSQCLGSFYVLGALTLVSSNAANASPWLYQSFAY